MKLHRSNARNLSDAEVVIFGVADESGSHAKRKGAGAAPDVLRAAWNEFEYFERSGKLIPVAPMRGGLDGKAVYDSGNIGKNAVARFTSELATQGKLPVIIGGDHSVTTRAIEGIHKALDRRISILYFDAHPDFVSSARNYYGSVLSDCSEWLDFTKSALVGTRASEPEEVANIRSSKLKMFSPIDIAEKGVVSVAERLVSRIGSSPTYVSVDLDCLDPAFAPGVSVPSPCGMSAIDLTVMLKTVMSKGRVVGLDMVELSPDYDFNGMTASLAAKLLTESIASLPS